MSHYVFSCWGTGTSVLTLLLRGDQPAPFSTLEEAVIRHLTFWRNGFQIGGTIRQYDDPASKYILETINAGYLFSTDKYINILRIFFFLQYCPGFRLERSSRPTFGTARRKSINRGLYFTPLGGCKGRF